jgi:hypothetical protein
MEKHREKLCLNAHELQFSRHVVHFRHVPSRIPSAPMLAANQEIQGG